jgi:membrane fusion protein, multidrug efflux system
MWSDSRRRSVILISALLLALGMTGCGETPPAAAPGGTGKAAKAGPAPVLVGQVQRQRVPLVIDAIGAVEPLRMTAVRSQVTGTLQRIAFTEGADVKAGDLLFEIDPRPFRNAVKTAEADLQKLTVQLETARAQVARYRALTAGQMVSQEQFQKIQDDARALDAEILSSESKLANARLQLDYSSIRAPISGRTGNLNVHEGDLVRANDSGPLVTINQLNPIYVTFGVPQQYLVAINQHRAERKLAVRAIPPGADDQPELGELAFIDNTVDATTGTIRLKATFTNERHRLWPGQFSTVTLTLAEPEVITAPASAVQTSQTGQHVFVVSAERIAELRPVVIERTHEGLAVVTQGLREGETVVVDGQLRVIPGRPVEIKQPGSPTPGTSPVVAKTRKET